MRRLLVVALAILLVGCSQTQNEESSVQSNSESADSAESSHRSLSVDNTEEASAPEAESSPIIQDKEYNLNPKSITIDAIDVESEVESVGLLENGEMEVPEDFRKTGWFDLGTNPGDRGSSVIAGHVDDKTGPGVFFDLNKLKKGDEVEVTGESGEKLVFEVVDKQRFPKEDAPINDIFGYTSRRMLNLITCIGEFDYSIGGRLERLVVYTELKSEG
ncbi:sortase, marine proteobacterial type [Oceanobacillus picturae]|jgi:sortase A|uniref:Sortase, marine proteobacterial type n=1 Tax=Oceanobacillus picturae TaxID=171693 RepID=W9AMI4_9BACI|nr:class F sortase [Oceanobacillus picturae]RIU89071.1 class F sortase [Oceanobacillus picturae]GAQ16660.1 sortase, marine proteobacterial type [Oceanobacillus picturae]CDO04087.1 sortase, marine proteobacterial type [Oceanobacillus picturae]